MSKLQIYAICLPCKIGVHHRLHTFGNDNNNESKVEASFNF